MNTRAAACGVLIYAKNLHMLTEFYRSALELTVVHADEYLSVLDGEGLQWVIHAIPPHIAGEIDIRSPPDLREECAIKPWYTVADLDATAKVIAAQGGALLGERWLGPDFTAVNAHDPEGNILQLRQRR